MKRLGSLTLGLLTAILLSSSAAGATETRSNPPFVGTWAVIATPGPGGPPPFAGLLILHLDGTLIESNGAVHPGSAGPAFPFNGSDGHGSWARVHGARAIAITFYKLIFDSAGTHLGYLRVRGIFSLDTDDADRFSGVTTVDLIFGADPLGPVAQSLPNTHVQGTPLGVIAPDA